MLLLLLLHDESSGRDALLRAARQALVHRFIMVAADIAGPAVARLA
jgi:hypothetical protein